MSEPSYANSQRNFDKLLVFMRVIWLHISVCWNRTPGQTIMYISIASGIAIPLIFLGATIGYSGFTYEIGPTCFIYQEHSFVVFWGWMIGFTIAAFVLQIITSGYCVTLYFMTHRLRIGSSASAKSSSTFGSLRYWTVRKKKRESEAEAYERAIRIFNQRRNRWKGIHRVLLLQWRIILLTVALVIQCLYFGSLSWAEDTKTASAPTNPKALAFGECLFLTDGNANKCMQYADALVLDKAAMLAGMGVMAVSNSIWSNGTRVSDISFFSPVALRSPSRHIHVSSLHPHRLVETAQEPTPSLPTTHTGVNRTKQHALRSTAQPVPPPAGLLLPPARLQRPNLPLPHARLQHPPKQPFQRTPKRPLQHTLQPDPSITSSAPAPRTPPPILRAHPRSRQQ